MKRGFSGPALQRPKTFGCPILSASFCGKGGEARTQIDVILNGARYIFIFPYKKCGPARHWKATWVGEPLYTRHLGRSRDRPRHARGDLCLPLNRRGFLKSLSRTAVVFSLEDVLSLARPLLGQAPAQKPTGSARQSYEAPARPAPKGVPSPVTATPLGIQFVDVAKEAGLNIETIFGGEHRNK